MVSTVATSMAKTLKYRYAIVGIGAIGLGLAQLLAQHKCTMLSRNPINTKQLKVTDAQADLSNASWPQTGSVNVGQKKPEHAHSTSLIQTNVRVLDTLSQEDWQDFNLLILPVKFYQLAPLIKQLRGNLPKTLPLLLMQNGLGGDELLSQAFPHNPLFIGSTTDAIAMLDKGHIQVNARGQLVVGSFDLTLPPAAVSALMQAHPTSAWEPNILSYLYQKLAANAVINPITAKFRCRNGEIVRYGDLVVGVKQELFALYQALGLKIDNDELNRYIDSVITLTANNYSSMCQDVMHGRPTEIDSILGVLLKKAAMQHMSLPLIKTLYEDIKRI